MNNDEKKIEQEIRKVVNSKAYKKFKFLYRKGIYNKEIYQTAERLLNRVLTKYQCVDKNGVFLFVNYDRILK